MRPASPPTWTRPGIHSRRRGRSGQEEGDRRRTRRKVREGGPRPMDQAAAVLLQALAPLHPIRHRCSRCCEQRPRPRVWGLAAAAIRRWFVAALIELSVPPHSDDAIREVSFDAIMDFVKLGKDEKFHSAIYHKFLHAVVHIADPVDPLLDLLGVQIL